MTWYMGSGTLDRLVTARCLIKLPVRGTDADLEAELESGGRPGRDQEGQETGDQRERGGRTKVLWP